MYDCSFKIYVMFWYQCSVCNLFECCVRGIKREFDDMSLARYFYGKWTKQRANLNFKLKMLIFKMISHESVVNLIRRLFPR